MDKIIDSFCLENIDFIIFYRTAREFTFLCKACSGGNSALQYVLYNEWIIVAGYFYCIITSECLWCTHQEKKNLINMITIGINYPSVMNSMRCLSTDFFCSRELTYCISNVKCVIAG